MSHGSAESAKLKAQVEAQLSRLLTQLQDCEDMKDELDEDEYNETREETLKEMQVIQASLEKMQSGGALVDNVGAVKLALQAAISNAFKTPEVVKLFASGQSNLLRGKLEEINQQHKLGKISDTALVHQSVEILTALEKMGEKLTDEEKKYMAGNMTAELKKFASADGGVAGGGQNKMLDQAGKQISAAK